MSNKNLAKFAKGGPWESFLKRDKCSGHSACPYPLLRAYNVDVSWRQNGHLATMTNREDKSHMFKMAKQKPGKNRAPSGITESSYQPEMPTLGFSNRRQ